MTQPGSPSLESICCSDLLFSDLILSATTTPKTDQANEAYKRLVKGKELRERVREMTDVTRTPHASERDEYDMSVRQIPKGFRWAGVLLIIACGLIHLVSAPDHLQEATYVGVLFLANGAGALVAAFGIYRNRLWGWVLGALVAGGAFVMFIVSRLIGLPAYQEHVGMWVGDSFGDRLGIPSVFVEAPLVVLAAVVVARRSREQQTTNAVGGGSHKG
jgi:uncharacterized membrane protein HdeD (DUF308 family)